MSVIPFFPLDDSIAAGSNASESPTTIQQRLPVEPTFDPENCSKPLGDYDALHFNQNYPEFCVLDPDASTGLPDMPPAIAVDVGDNFYLAPTLTSNERLRLNTLWYYTKNLYSNANLLASIQVKVDMLREFTGWDMAICGFIDNSTFRRVVTAGVELRVLPRRESTCSHTIQGKAPGTVLSLSDMSKDWRFKNSPHVSRGGLRSYAGTPLRVRVSATESVALGSLCLASTTAHKSLTKHQQDSIVRFADMIVSEIISTSRLERREEQQRMGELLSEATSHGDINRDEVAIMRALSKVYPDAEVSVCHVIMRNGVSMFEKYEIPTHQVDHGLWEDAAGLDDLISKCNQEELKSLKPMRAVVSRTWNPSQPKALLVAAKNISHVFDDIDSWFVDRCAAILISIEQERSLTEARQAKERFLRGMTHTLRTPIHGVLGSVDLLAEELAAKNLMRLKSSPDPTKSINALADAFASPKLSSIEGGHASVDTSDVLRTIQNLGRELMSTVNNMIKLNRWAEVIEFKDTIKLCQLTDFEETVLDDATKMIPDAEVDRLCVFFDNQLISRTDACNLDVNILKECVQSLLLNAFQYTSRGCVIIQISSNDEYSKLMIDIIDTGSGIEDANKARIFEAYEKENPHSRGAGLGLTLASKMANAISGSVELIDSTPGKGSHFRMTIPNPALACIYRPDQEGPIEHVPEFPKFCTIPSEPKTITVQHYVKYLKRLGVKEVSKSNADDEVTIVSFIPLPEQFQQYLEDAKVLKGVAICLIPAGEDIATLERCHPQIAFYTGPFTTKRLDDIMGMINVAYKKKAKKLSRAKTNGIQHLASRSRPTSSPIDGLLAAPWDMTPQLRIGPPNVLLVDDNLINLRIIKMYCEKRTYSYGLAIDGLEAIAQYRKALESGHLISLILLDLQMPNCDGIEACTEIRKIEKARGLQASVIFIITGQDSPSDRECSLAAGADEFYVKPMTIKALDKGISRYFRTESPHTNGSN